VTFVTTCLIAKHDVRNGPCGTCFEAVGPCSDGRNWPRATANPVGMVVSLVRSHGPGDVGAWIRFKDPSGRDRNDRRSRCRSDLAISGSSKKRARRRNPAARLGYRQGAGVTPRWPVPLFRVSPPRRLCMTENYVLPATFAPRTCRRVWCSILGRFEVGNSGPTSSLPPTVTRRDSAEPCLRVGHPRLICRPRRLLSTSHASQTVLPERPGLGRPGRFLLFDPVRFGCRLTGDPGIIPLCFPTQRSAFWNA
jgi:hypothetical protein